MDSSPDSLKLKTWPKCPSCSTYDLVLHGLNFACCSCGKIGAYKALEPSDFAAVAMASAIASSSGTTMSVVFSGDDSVSDIQAEKSVQLWVRNAHFDAIKAIAVEAASRERIFPVGIVSKFASILIQDSYPIRSPQEWFRFMAEAAKGQVATVIWVPENESDVDFSVSKRFRSCQIDKSLMVNTHFFCSASVASMINLEGACHEKELDRTFLDQPVKSLIPQMVDWASFHLIPGQIEPRFFAARKFADRVLNVSVTEDLDGGCRLRVSTFTEKTASIAAQIKADETSLDVDELVAAAKERVKNIDSTILSASLTSSASCDLEWGFETSVDEAIVEVKKCLKISSL